MINNEAIIESLISFKIAGASEIVTYFDDEIASKINIQIERHQVARLDQKSISREEIKAEKNKERK